MEQVNFMWIIHLKNGVSWEGNPWGLFMLLLCLLLFFCFMFSFFESYFVEFLAAFNCWEVLWKKVVLKIFPFNNQQLVSRQNLLRNTWVDWFLVRFATSLVACKDYVWILRSSSRTAINALLCFFFVLVLFYNDTL